eukprot:COSAG02_NODE_5055_length_4686_cov_9.954654_3_plen_68_part_00
MKVCGCWHKLFDGDHVILGQLLDGLCAVHSGLVRCVQGDGDLLRRPESAPRTISLDTPVKNSTESNE